MTPESVRATVQGVARRVVSALTYERAIAVSPTYVEDMGWAPRRDDALISDGSFRIPCGFEWQGIARRGVSGQCEFFIKNPPIPYLRQTRWGGCFHSQGEGWYLVGVHAVNNHGPITDISSGIASINDILAQTYLQVLGVH